MVAGVVYVAYGTAARREARFSAESLKRYHPMWPVTVISNEPVGWARTVPCDNPGTPGRWAKVNLDKLSPYNPTLFLDADTRVYGRLDVGFAAVYRWDMVMVASKPQGGDVLGHLIDDERAHTLAELPVAPLQLNTGVMWFRKTAAVKRMFAEWRRQWKRWKDKDQGALLRALNVRPVSIFLLGWPYNGGAIIGHRFGACRG